MENPFDRSRRRAVRTGAGMCLAGVGAIIGAAISNSFDALSLGILTAQAGAALIAVQPLGWAAGAALRHPALLPDRHRMGAALGGLFSLSIAWGAFAAGDGVRNGPILAAVLAVLGLAGLAALRPPRLKAWRPPLAVPVGALLLLLFVPAPGMFQGTKPRAYYNNMRALTEEILQWQNRVRADSGRYATALDRTALHEDRFALATARFEPAPDGYRVRVTSQGLEPTLACAVYEGATPAEPASRPGVVTCTPYPNYIVSTLASWWLAGVVLTGAFGFLLRREALAAPA
jgi:hypothetical protein